MQKAPEPNRFGGFLYGSHPRRALPPRGFGGGLGSAGSSEFDLTPRSLDEEAPF